MHDERLNRRTKEEPAMITTIFAAAIRMPHAASVAAPAPLALGVSGYYTFIQFGPLIEEDAGFSVTCGDDVAQTGWRYLTALAATDDHVAEYASSHAEIRDAVERGSTGESVGAMIQLGLRCSE